MEILKDSDAIEKQIADDARKKVKRILENADKTVAELTKAGTLQMEAELKTIGDKTAEVTQRQKRETLASLPLEKKRKSLAFLVGQLEEALTRYFAELDSDAFAELLRSELIRVKNVLKPDTPVDVFYSPRLFKLNKQEVQDILAAQKIKAQSFSEDNTVSGVVLMARDEALKIKITVEEITKYLLTDKREDLFASLFPNQEKQRK